MNAENLEILNVEDIKSKIDAFICRKLAEIDISDITNEGDWEKDLGMRVELAPSPQLGKELLEYYGANINIDEIIITHGEEIGTKVMLAGIGTNGNDFLTDFNNLSEKNKKAIEKLYQQWEHEYGAEVMLSPVEESQENEEINRLLSEAAQLKNQVEETKEQADNLHIATENRLNRAKDIFDEKANTLLTNIDNLIGIKRMQDFYSKKRVPLILLERRFTFNKGTDGQFYVMGFEKGDMKASSYLSDFGIFGLKEFVTVLKNWDKLSSMIYKDVNAILKGDLEKATNSIEHDENLIEEYDEYDFD